jgi:hypothetical protein
VPEEIGAFVSYVYLLLSMNYLRRREALHEYGVLVYPPAKIRKAMLAGCIAFVINIVGSCRHLL